MLIGCRPPRMEMRAGGWINRELGGLAVHGRIRIRPAGANGWSCSVRRGIMYRCVCLPHRFVCSLFSGLAVSTSGNTLPNLGAGGAAFRNAVRGGCYLLCGCHSPWLLNSSKLQQLNNNYQLQGTHAVFVNHLL